MIRKIGLLLCLFGMLTHSVMAQTTLNGTRVAANSATTARFTLGLTLNNGFSYVSTATTADSVRIIGTIAPEAAQVGQPADIFVVAKIGPSFFMRNTSGNFVPWNFSIPELVAYRTKQTLTSNFEVDFITSKIPVTGTLQLFLGYKASDGVLIYTPVPHSITITAATGTEIPGTQLGGTRFGAVPDLSNVVTSFVGRLGTPSIDGTGTAAGFYEPHGMTTDGTNLYVTDSNNHSIRKVVIATGAVTTIAGSGKAGSADGIGLAASFFKPLGITTDGTNLYVADTSNNKIRKIDMSTGAVSTLAGSGTLATVDGTGTAASFKSPSSITTDGTRLYVGEGGSIRQIILATGAVSTMALKPVSGFLELLTNGYPGITTDGFNLYLTTGGSYTIRKVVIATGEISTFAGTRLSGAVDGVGTAASFSLPYGITTDGTNLYIGDYNNKKIRKIVIATRVVSTLAGTGQFGDNDGVGTAAGLNYPDGIVSDGTSLFFADSGNNKIRLIGGATPKVTAVTPIFGKAGASVTITGSGFSALPLYNSVKFNGVAGAVTASTTTSIKVTIPTGATTGALGVTNATSNRSTTSTDSFIVSSANTPPFNVGTTNPNGGTVPAFIANLIGTFPATINTSQVTPFVAGGATLTIASNGVITLNQGDNALAFNCVNSGSGASTRLCSSNVDTGFLTNEIGITGVATSVYLDGTGTARRVSPSTSIIFTSLAQEITFK